MDKETSFQKTHYGKAEIERFFWQTQNKYVKKKETDLLKPLIQIILKTNTKNVLEIGCGEGANIKNIIDYGSAKLKNVKFTGTDYSEGKINFARHQITAANTAFKVMDGTDMKYGDNSFDIVFMRDVLHHVPEKEKILNEALRLARKRVVIIENNGNNPIMRLFGTLVRVEKNIKNSTPSKIMKLICRSKHAGKVSMVYLEPCPLFRLIFHYRYGLQSLANVRFIEKLMDIKNKAASVIVPKRLFGYVLYSIEKN